MGTGGALRLALPYLLSDPIIVMNGDSFINVDINDYMAWFLKTNCRASILLTKVSDISRYGRVITDSNGQVVTFEEKGGNGNEGWINAGVYIMQKSLIESIPPGKYFSLERQFFPKLVKCGLYGFRFNGDFIDIGTPETYATAEDFFKNRCI